MGLIELFLIGVGLSMDAFAAAVCKGLGMKRLNRRRMLAIGLFFGGFQAIMPALGWLLGKRFEALITPFDHWIAFALLSVIGVKMIRDGASGVDEPIEDAFHLSEVLVLAIATSIDALALGVTFAFLQVNILLASLTIGLTTFCLSCVGVFIGRRFGRKYEARAQYFGGALLILIGLKILWTHLFS